MVREVDPEGVETRAIRDLIDFADKDVLEIGCGDGRMTRRYADLARSVLAIDPDGDVVAVARAQTPDALRDRVEFRQAGNDDVVLADGAFDVVILSWSI
jgi:2-polyprenyl-3-methyl-5-hydroxy-6-metoxy-1,4-benzoquinol methylase